MWLGTLIGNFLALFLGNESSYDLIYKGIKVKVRRVNRMIPKWAAGQTWGKVILVRVEHASNKGLMNHELVHVEQWKKYSIFFIPVYIAFTIEAAIKYGWGQGYTQNRLEREARIVSGH